MQERPSPTLTPSCEADVHFSRRYGNRLISPGAPHLQKARLMSCASAQGDGKASDVLARKHYLAVDVARWLAYRTVLKFGAPTSAIVHPMSTLQVFQVLARVFFWLNT